MDYGKDYTLTKNGLIFGRPNSGIRKLPNPSADGAFPWKTRRKNHIVPVQPKTTSGWIVGRVEQAFVYIGKNDIVLIKIGMSGKPLYRCQRHLKIELIFTVPVVVEQAKRVETITLQNLGVTVKEGEWVKCTVEQAVDALCCAWKTVEKCFHVDPAISAEDARMARIRSFS